MKKLNKKAFTIVELVIVIAVIAVLAAVLIPTFVSLLRKSKVSNDTSLVRELNEALAEDKVFNKHNTMTDVLKATEEYGYIADRLIARAKDNEILWDSVNDVFCYLNDGKVEYLPESSVTTPLEAGDYRLWKIYTKAPTIADGKVVSDYSIYVANQEVATAIDGKIINVGLDVGNADVAAVNYVNAAPAAARNGVVIRTNSHDTVLTINAPADTVKHYDKANKINVEAVAMSSYHEFGDILGNINLTAGNVVVEEGCKASAVVIDMTAAQLATVTSLSADNSQAPEVPIILNTSETLWDANPHKDLIDPKKNNIIYANFGGGTLPDNFDTLSKEEKEAAIETASAEDKLTKYVAIIDDTGYTDFKTSMTSAKNGETVKLLQSISYTCTSNVIDIPANKNITLDANEKTVTVTGATGAAANRLFDISGSLIINGGTFVNSSKNGPFIVVSENGSLICNNSTMSTTEKRETINTNGSQSGVNIELNNCVINGRCYFPAEGTYTINGGTYSGRIGAFYFKSGNININGGKFVADGTDGDWYHGNSGCGYIGCAIIVEACNYGEHWNPIVNIKSGEFIPGADGTNYKNYGILIINYNGNNAIMTGTTVSYRIATVDPTGWHSVSGCIIPGTAITSSAHFYHFNDSNTTSVNP